MLRNKNYSRNHSFYQAVYGNLPCVKICCFVSLELLALSTWDRLISLKGNFQLTTDLLFKGKKSIRCEIQYEPVLKCGKAYKVLINLFIKKRHLTQVHHFISEKICSQFQDVEK